MAGMIGEILEENNPALKSYITVDADNDFPIQNLPFGVFKPKDTKNNAARVGVAIGDYVLDCDLLDQNGFFSKIKAVHNQAIFAKDGLNHFMSLGRSVTREVRQTLSQLLRHDNPVLRDNDDLREQAFFHYKDVNMLLPAKIGAYTDFYSSIEHATNVGSMFRDPSDPLLPNWRHIPVGYDGRANMVVVSGTEFRRPKGQSKSPEQDAPSFGPCKALDIEIEVAFLIGKPNQFGEPIDINNAQEHVFGLVLLNDWSARDIQKWEYVPLGPFLSKSFCTTISPWVVTLDALEPFRVKGSAQKPAPLNYLQHDRTWSYDINLEFGLKIPGMINSETISQVNFKTMYWDFCQQLAHHTVNGCAMNTGDLFASGTVSGPTQNTTGCLLELTWGGRDPIQLSNGEKRVYLKDEDEAIISGWCQGKNYRIGFGQARGKVLPAL